MFDMPTHRLVDGELVALTEQEAAEIAAVWDAERNSPPPAWRGSSLQFIERFTEQEQVAIVTATLANAAVKLWYDKMLAADEVIADDQRTVAGMSALVGAGLLTQERANQILGVA